MRRVHFKKRFTLTLIAGALASCAAVSGAVAAHADDDFTGDVVAGPHGWATSTLQSYPGYINGVPTGPMPAPGPGATLCAIEQIREQQDGWICHVPNDGGTYTVSFGYDD